VVIAVAASTNMNSSGRDFAESGTNDAGNGGMRDSRSVFPPGRGFRLCCGRSCRTWTSGIWAASHRV